MTIVRRPFKPQFKAQTVLEGLAGLRGTVEICRKRGIEMTRIGGVIH